MKIRLRMVPIETLEPGQTFLNALTNTGKGPREYNIYQGPCVLEYKMDDDLRNPWLPVEFVQ